MEVTREEMLELAKYDTYHLDDRLCPFSREDLRAESWLRGYGFARRHPQESDEETVNEPLPAVSQWSKEDREMVGRLIRHFEKELDELHNDRVGHQEIVSDMKESCREKIGWLEALRDRMGKEETEA